MSSYLRFEVGNAVAMLQLPSQGFLCSELSMADIMATPPGLVPLRHDGGRHDQRPDQGSKARS